MSSAISKPGGGTYTSIELSSILLEEQKKSITHKVILQPEQDAVLKELANAPEAPIMGKFLYGLGGGSSLMGVLNYWHIRDQVEAYQRQHGISGLLQETKTIRGVKFTYWDHEDQLALLDRDVPVLEAEVPRLVELFLELTRDYDRYIDVGSRDEDYRPIDEAAIRRHARNGVYCWIYASSCNWVKHEDGDWRGTFYQDGDGPIDPDEIKMSLYLSRPDDSDCEQLYFRAEHRDPGRRPWLTEVGTTL